jgi:hypothetical protein
MMAFARFSFRFWQVGLLAAVVLMLPPPAQAEPKELRYYMVGNSLTDQVKYDFFQKLVESRGHKPVWGRSMTPGAPISWHWANKPAFTQAPFGDFRKAFADYEWDAVTLQPFSTYGAEIEGAKQMLGLIKLKSPGAQVYVYSQWMNATSGDFDRIFTEVLPKLTGSTSGIRQFYEVFLQELAAAHPEMKPPRLIPAGHALYLFNQKIQAGEVPGFTSIWEVYNDGIHLGNVGSYFVACSFFATLFGESPVGLPSEQYNKDRSGRGDRELTPDLVRLIQETVWETVTGLGPLTGVSAPETPPKVASPRLGVAVEGIPYQFQLLGAHGTPPYAWRVAAGSLLEGFALSPEGLLTGTGGAAGSMPVTFEVKDQSGRTATRELALVTEANSKPVITEDRVPEQPAGKYFEHKIRAEGGNGGLTWTVAGRGKNQSVLPPGLALATDGTLRGSAVRPGEYSFTVEARDADPKPDVATKTLTLTVLPAGPDVVFAETTAGKNIKLDGALDEPEWKLEHSIEKLVEGKPGEVKGRFGVLSAGGTLYIGVEVTTPEIQENGADLAQGDSVEIYLDLFNNREAVYNADDRRITVTPGGKVAVVGRNAVLGVKTKRTSTGYTVEASLPSYNTQVKLADAAIGVDVGINTVRNGGRTRLVWRGTAANDTDPSQFGTVIFLTPEQAGP